MPSHSADKDVSDSQGAPPPDQPRMATEGPTTPLPKPQDPSASDGPMLQETWVDLDDFAKCFQ